MASQGPTVDHLQGVAGPGDGGARRRSPEQQRRRMLAELERIRDDQREVAKDLAASAASSLPSLQRVPEVTEALLAE